MKIKHLSIIVMMAGCIAASASLNAQIFSSTGGVTAQNAQEVGEPGSGNGQVFTKTAPGTPNRKAQVINDLTTAGIPDNIINLQNFMGNGAFSVQISDMWAVKQTAKNVRKVTSRSATPPGGIYIWNTQRLNEERAKIASNQTHTFIFTGWTNVDKPIFVGSNTTIWIDGTLNYNGQDMPRTAMGAAFTPRPSKYDGVLNIRPAGNFQDEGTQAGRNNNSSIRNGWNNSSDRKSNINIFGTRNGQILVGQGNWTDSFGQKLPKVNGITLMRASKVNIEGVTIKNSFQAIFLQDLTHSVNFTNNFFDNTLYRAMHIKGAWSPPGYGNIKNNLLTNSKYDGIDVDSFAQGFNITENVVIGARDRLMYWTEIDAKNNTFNNNVGIVLPASVEGSPKGNGGKGTFQENGTEACRNPSHPSYPCGGGNFSGTSNNKWLNNHAFYAERHFDGFVMRKERYIQFNTITFTNNYVWTLKNDIVKHNPKRNVSNDVYYLFGNGSTPPPPPPTGSGGFYIVNRQTGLKIRPETSADASRIIQIAASATGNFVRWEEVPTSGGYFYLKNVETGKYFRPATDFEAALMEQRPTSYSGNYTQWRKVSTSNGYFYLQNRQTGQYFRPQGDGINSPMEQRPTTYSGNYTQWKFENAGSARIAGIEALGNEPSLSIYPNPARLGDNLSIDLTLQNKGELQLQVFNSNGIEVYNGMLGQYESGRNTITITPSEIRVNKTGIYLLKMKSNDTMITRRIMIQN